MRLLYQELLTAWVQVARLLVFVGYGVALISPESISICMCVVSKLPKVIKLVGKVVNLSGFSHHNNNYTCTCTCYSGTKPLNEDTPLILTLGHVPWVSGMKGVDCSFSACITQVTM